MTSWNGSSTLISFVDGEIPNTYALRLGRLQLVVLLPARMWRCDIGIELVTRKPKKIYSEMRSPPRRQCASKCTDCKKRTFHERAMGMSGTQGFKMTLMHGNILWTLKTTSLRGRQVSGTAAVFLAWAPFWRWSVVLRKPFVCPWINLKIFHAYGISLLG